MEYTVMSMKYYIVYELYTDVYRVLRHAIVIMFVSIHCSKLLYMSMEYNTVSILTYKYTPINYQAKGFFLM